MAAPKGDTPSWHSAESAKIEALRWRESNADFQFLCWHVSKKISAELREQGKDLSNIVTDDEIRQQVRLAAESYDEKRRRLIGLEIHVTLWLRGFVSTKLREKT
jgi:hypothetical protein